MSESKKSVEQVERERLTRRQALRRLGFGAGMSAIMLLGADDLARMVGDRMRQMEGDGRVADQIAKEFRSAGVAFASPVSVGDPCQDCWNHLVCADAECDCFFPGDASCKDNNYIAFKHCTDKHCPADGPGPAKIAAYCKTCVVSTA